MLSPQLDWFPLSSPVVALELKSFWSPASFLARQSVGRSSSVHVNKRTVPAAILHELVVVKSARVDEMMTVLSQ
jgi:hypothetical protein